MTTAPVLIQDGSPCAPRTAAGHPDFAKCDLSRIQPRCRPAAVRRLTSPNCMQFPGDPPQDKIWQAELDRFAVMINTFGEEDFLMDCEIREKLLQRAQRDREAAQLEVDAVERRKIR